MPDYIDLPVETDPEELAQEQFDDLEAAFPGWTPNDGNLDTIIIRANARQAAELRDQLQQTARSIFRYYGESIIGIPPIPAAPASASSTWTMINNAGYTIPAGTQVAIAAAGNDLRIFQTVGDVTVAPGSTATAAGGVPLVSIEEGAQDNGLTGTPTLVTPLTFVASIALEGATGGGVDEEVEDVYLSRLASQLQLASPRPILARDFSVLARNISGVDRATTIDGYNPANGTSNNERMVTVVGLDANGAALTTAKKNELAAYLDALREVNFVVNVADPTFHPIGGTYTVRALAGFDRADVLARINGDLAIYFSSANWGRPPGTFRSSEWINTPTIRYLEVAEVINRVNGVDYIVSLAINQDNGANVSTDLTMSGIAPLPQPGTWTGTVQ